MEAEVSALMGVADEAIWKQAGLFSSVDTVEFNAIFNSLWDVVKAQLSPSPMVNCKKLGVTFPPLSIEAWSLVVQKNEQLISLCLLKRFQGCRRVVTGGCLGGVSGFSRGKDYWYWPLKV
jgi:hypothetical protein